MDYTTLARFKSELHATQAADDALIGTLITAASRAIDRKVTGAVEPATANYFELETIVGETIRGMFGTNQQIVVYPRKPFIASVSQMQYRASPMDPWSTIDLQVVVWDGPRVEAWMESQRLVTTRANLAIPGKVFVLLNYSGGFATDPTTLPEDIQEVATMLAIRYYREAESGLQDSIGVAELTQLVFTKAWPTRALDLLRPYMRRTSWRGYT